MGSVVTMIRFALLIAIISGVSGCAALFPPLPSETPLAASWHRYQGCVKQSQHALTQCQNLRLAYEAQLTRAGQR